MGRHSADAPSEGSGDQPAQHDAFSEYETGSQARLVPRGPPASRRRVAVAVGVAMLGIVLLVFGLISLISAPDDPTSTSSQNTTSVAETTPASTTEQPPVTTAEPTTPVTSAAPQPAAVLPVTVLNNSAVVGLASRVAAELEAGGWPIAQLLNYDETQVPATTVFFTPGNAAEEAAAQALVAQFPEISGGAEPRFAGLDGTGLTVAAVGDWVP